MNQAKLKFTSILLLLFANISVPVLADSSSITNIQFSPTSPSTLFFGEQVNLSFDYQNGETSSVLIFARPFTNGSLTPGYFAHGSPLYPVGSGVGSGYFLFDHETTVDQVRFQIYDSQNTVVLEMFVPVDFRYVEAPQPSTPVPTMSEWSLMLLALLLGLVGITRVRQQV